MKIVENILNFFEYSDFANRRIFFINILFVIFAFVFAFDETKVRLIYAVILLLWLTVIQKDALLEVFKAPVILSLLFLATIIGFSAFYISDNGIYTMKMVDRILMYLLVPMIMAVTSIRQSYIPKIIGSFILGMILNEIISYGILFHLWLHLNDEGYPVYFMHHVFYSVLLSFVLMLLVYRVVYEKNMILKILEVIFIVTMFGNLIISGGRTGQITLLATFMLTFMIYKKVTLKTLVSIIVLPIIVFALTYKVYEPFEERTKMFISDTQNIINHGNYNTSFGNRVFAYVLTAKMLEVSDLKTVLIGSGIDNVQETKNAFIARYFPQTPNMQTGFMQFHSSYVDIIWWVGLVGFAFMILFLIAILRIKVQDNQMRYIKISLFFVLLFAYIPDSSLTNQHVMMLTVIFVSLLLIQEKHERIQTNAC